MPTNNDKWISRRRFLANQSLGMGGVAFAWALNERSLSAAPKRPELTVKTFNNDPRQPDSEPQAKAMISLWMQGGPSHIDLFDPKPKLTELDGQSFPGKIKYDNAAQASSKVLGSPWKFSNHGECGMELSELIPNIATIADEITLIRSMHTGVNNHGQSIKALQTGVTQNGYPTIGSWLTYGLGCESNSLPPFMALIDPGQLPVEGVANWSNGYLPSIYQGTVIRPTEPRILNLTPPEKLAGKPQERYLSLLDKLNKRHIENSPGELDFSARVEMYELAARMQVAAKEAMDLSQETEETKNLYGMDDPDTTEYGSRCLIARRLIERGVRFVQVYTQNQYWDHHGGILKSLPSSCKKVDKPSAALVKDLKRRGLLDSTVVHWGGEMGRLPVIQNEANIGRDHNTYGFSSWVAGGGFKAGYTHGATDEFGHHAVENVVNHFDYHHTILHLFGIRPEELTYEHNGRRRKLIETESRLVTELLA